MVLKRSIMAKKYFVLPIVDQIYKKGIWGQYSFIITYLRYNGQCHLPLPSNIEREITEIKECPLPPAGSALQRWFWFSQVFAGD